MKRKLLPSRDLDPLPPEEREKLWSDMNDGLSYDRALRLLGAEHFLVIRRHKLFTWFHREKERRELNANLPGQHQLDAANYLALLNSETLPWPQLIHSHIYKATFALVTSSEEHTPNRLLTLQRIANNPFNQEITRAKLALEKRKQSFREELAVQKTAPDPVVPRPLTREEEAERHARTQARIALARQQLYGIAPAPASPSASEPQPLPQTSSETLSSSSNTGIHAGAPIASTSPGISTLSREPSDSECQMKNAHLNSRSEQHDLEAKSEAGLVTPSMFNENARSPSPAVQQSEKSAPSLIQSSTPCEAPNLNAK